MSKCWGWILNLLLAVERGDSVLEVERAAVFSGVVVYRVSSGGFEGAKIGVFNDCGEWDYLEYVEEGGDRIAWNDFCECIKTYRPRDEDIETTWKWKEATR